jgi:Zn-dependent metalloprotease
MRASLRWLLLVALLSFAAPLYAKKAPAVEPTMAQAGITRRHAIGASLSKPDMKAIPGATVRFDVATGLARKVVSPGLAALGKTPAAAANAFLKANHRRFGVAADLSDLLLLSTQASPGGFHVRYQQVWSPPGAGACDGRLGATTAVPMWDAQVAVHLSKDLKLQLAQSTVAAVAGPVASAPRFGAKMAVQLAEAAVGVRGALRGSANASLVLYAGGKPARLCWRVLIPASVPLGDWEVLVDAVSGEAVLGRNLLKFVDGSGTVFDPNPVTTSGNPTLVDRHDRDYPALTEELFVRPLLGLDGSGRLVGPYVTTAPTKKQALEADFTFDYTRSDNRFEQAMVYYHIDTCQRYLQFLGFTNANNRPQPVNVNGTGVDNSWYSPATGIITYGKGGVDDAEDADVIMHEYGHAIQDNQVPNFGLTEEGGAMGEGFGDYLAATRYAEANWAWRVYIAEWDATSYSSGNPPYLRRVDSTKHYPEDLAGEVHADGEIWSACLWQMREALGAASADAIVIESHFYLTAMSEFSDGAEAIILADHNLNGGANETVIRQIFSERGIL